MRVELIDDDRLDKVVEFFYFQNCPITDEEYARIEKKITDYCKAEGIDFWEPNIHMTVNGKEYAKTDKPEESPVTVEEPDVPYFEPFGKHKNRFTGGGYELKRKEFDYYGYVHL